MRISMINIISTKTETYLTEHFLCGYIVKQKQNKFADFIKKNFDSQNLVEIELC